MLPHGTAVSLGAGSAAADSSYQQLQDGDEEQGLGPAILDLGDPKPEVATSVAECAKELRLGNDKVEELEIKTRVHKKSTSASATAMIAELAALKVRREELKRLMGAAESTDKSDTKGDEEEQPNSENPVVSTSINKFTGAGSEAALCVAKVLGPFMNTVTNTATGTFAICLYFADILSDVQVVTLPP